MMAAFVVDTNVGIVANQHSTQATPDCVLACIKRLQGIVKSGLIVLDDKGLILAEYRRYLSPRGQPGTGDAFMKWVFQNQGNSESCEIVEISPTNNRHPGFDKFPDDQELDKFDPSDRKFVAVALGSTNSPKVQNAVDSDWWIFRDQLAKHGVEIDFLCPEQFATAG